MQALCVHINLINVTFGALLPRLHQRLPNTLIVKRRMQPGQRALQSTQLLCEKTPQASSSGEQTQASSTSADSRRDEAKSTTARANPTSADPAIRSRCYTRQP